MKHLHKCIYEYGINVFKKAKETLITNWFFRILFSMNVNVINLLISTVFSGQNTLDITVT